MRKYYTNDGEHTSEPLTIEELKNLNITPDTPIWYEGLDEWTTAKNIEELKELFKATPPPIKNTVQPPPISNYNENSPSDISHKKRNRLIIVALLILIGIISFNVYFNSNPTTSPNSFYNSGTTSPKPMYPPQTFLSIDGNYRVKAKNTKINAIINNSAPIGYKDIVVTVNCYSQTGTLIETKDYVVYKFIGANSTLEFKSKVPTPRQTDYISLSISSATTMN